MLTVTRLEVVRPFKIESGHGSIVMAASMKTPHRHLRSNEIKLGSDGLLDIPLQLTFCLQVKYMYVLYSGNFFLDLRWKLRFVTVYEAPPSWRGEVGDMLQLR